MGESELRECPNSGAGAVPVALPDGLHLGDVVEVPARVVRVWRDADAAKRRGDSGRRADLEVPGGRILHGVPIGELQDSRRD